MRRSLWLLSSLLVLFCAKENDTLQSKKLEGFSNPILAGFYPDPSICKVADDYYIITSTFAYFPGIPIFHSQDLVNWKLIGHVMDRPEQLDLDSLGVSRGIFAPAIRYHQGIFYVTCTLVDKGGNLIVTAITPAGPWSNPVWLPQIDGIDPSLFFDDDGQAYILYNSVAPENKLRDRSMPLLPAPRSPAALSAASMHCMRPLLARLVKMLLILIGLNILVMIEYTNSSDDATRSRKGQLI